MADQSSSTASSPSAAPTISLVDFLREQKQSPSSHVVIGNQAGDADSIISAIGWAYTERLAAAAATARVDDEQCSSIQKTPVISIPARNLATQRPETTLLLEMAGIPPEQHSDLLHFIDGTFWTSAQDLDVTLVDHNRMTIGGDDKNKNHRVVGIVDHHLDEGYHRDTCLHREIAFENGKACVASTCTLVVERLQQQPYNFPAPLSILLLGVILLDSVNMNPAAGKATPRDGAAIQRLLEGTDWAELRRATTNNSNHGLKWVNVNDEDINQQRQQPNTTALFEALQNAKFDPALWKSLSVRDALRLDYKSFSYANGGSFGMSTVLLSMEDFLKKDELAASIRSYMQDMQLCFFGIMLSFTNSESDSMQRQLVLCSNDNFSMGDLVNFLQQPESPLELTERKDNATKEDGLTLRCFDQGNPKASRKQVAPLFLQFFEKKST